MPSFGSIKRIELIKYLKKLGFTGPFSGGKHQFMEKGDVVLTIPNPHSSDIGKELLGRLLKQGLISRSEWENL